MLFAGRFELRVVVPLLVELAACVRHIVAPVVVLWSVNEVRGAGDRSVQAKTLQK